jgi:Transposase DDE domain
MRVVVHSAAIQDRDGAGLVLDKIRRRFPRLELIWADGAYNAWPVDAAVAKVPRLRLEIVKRRDDMKGFVVLPRRWLVERTFSWFGRNRRLGQGLREPCRNPGHFRYPRLHPTGPQAARQGVGRDGGGLQSMDSRPSPTPGPAAGLRRFRTFPPSPLSGEVRPATDLRRDHDVTTGGGHFTYYDFIRASNTG